MPLIRNLGSGSEGKKADAGFYINKFREIRNFKARFTGNGRAHRGSVVGVLPYVSLSLVEEDSLWGISSETFSCLRDFSWEEIDQELDWWSKP